MGAGVPIPVGPLPLPALKKKQGRGPPLIPKQKSHSWHLDLLQPEVEMSFVPSGQFLPLPSPFCTNLAVKVFVVSQSDFFVPLNTYVFYSMWAMPCKHAPLGLH